MVNKSIDFHCHGVGHFDFTDIAALNLAEIESILAIRNQQTVLTLYLPKFNFDSFLLLMETVYLGKQAGKYPHIAGLSLEGPLLASHGGTPETGVWMPSKAHWKELARCGKQGLIYIVISPDAYLPGGNFIPDSSAPSLTWITETLLEGGVLPAPGHFIKSNPQGSALQLQNLFNIVEAWGHGATITDHLFNDMPRNFKHAWRTPEEQLRRDKEIKEINIDSWTLDLLDQQLGEVPATIIKNAHKGLVKVCQNFDGEHVDLTIVKKTVELLGAENMLMMTDSIESKRLAGRSLHMRSDSTLLYQEQGVVAAGSQGVERQLSNMVAMNLSDEQIDRITYRTPCQILEQHRHYVGNR
ncbi:MAG: hypothetical protein HKM04_10350 [Legionellales bacterium]|nr:hypothetical protein [Legionellales bacterium]